MVDTEPQHMFLSLNDNPIGSLNISLPPKVKNPSVLLRKSNTSAGIWVHVIHFSCKTHWKTKDECHAGHSETAFQEVIGSAIHFLLWSPFVTSYEKVLWWEKIPVMDEFFPECCFKKQHVPRTEMGPLVLIETFRPCFGGGWPLKIEVIGVLVDPHCSIVLEENLRYPNRLRFFTAESLVG